jgi:hypothetical protein
MKRWVGLGLSALLLLAGIVVVGPYHTLHQLRLAIETRDTARLENQVDFPRLRENIKLQLNDRAAQSAPPRWRESPLAGLAMGLATQVTPAGLLGLLEQQTVPAAQESPPADPEQPASPDRREIEVRDVQTGFESPSRFAVEATTPQGERLRIILSRQGLKWRVTELVLPDWAGSLGEAGREQL